MSNSNIISQLPMIIPGQWPCMINIIFVYLDVENWHVYNFVHLYLGQNTSYRFLHPLKLKNGPRKKKNCCTASKYWVLQESKTIQIAGEQWFGATFGALFPVPQLLAHRNIQHITEFGLHNLPTINKSKLNFTRLKNINFLYIYLDSCYLRPSTEVYFQFWRPLPKYSWKKCPDSAQ